MNDNKDIRNTAKYILSNPVLACGFIFLISCLSLAFALVAQHVFDLQPCVLCLYQRWPYGINALLGAAGLALLYKEEWTKRAAVTVFLASLFFFAGGVIASYHVGVEQHWWTSILEGCAVDFDTSSVDDLVALFDNNKPAVRCDEVAWRLFGISMAGYNVLMSFALAGISLWSSILIVRRANGVL